MTSLEGESTSRLNRAGKTRKKRWTPKVKTGCLTCRIRKVKCDEAKPSCWKCVSTGRKCDGYRVPGTENETSSVQSVSTGKTSSYTALVAPAWNMLPGDDVENENFHFFRSVTTSNLAAFFDFGFWSHRLLQISHHYPALWHAMTALAYIHRQYITDSTPLNLSRKTDNQQIVFALKQFNKSIQALTVLLSGKCLNSLDKEVVLITSILFSCLSSLQGQQMQAFMHINNGLKLLHQWNLGARDPKRFDRNVGSAMLLLILTRLDTQIRPYIPWQPAVIQWTESPVIPSATPTESQFESILEAYVDLEVLFNGMIQLFTTPEYNTMPQNYQVLAEKAAYVRGFENWDTRLANYLAVTPQVKNEKGLRLLYIRRMFARVLLAFNPAKGELTHDDLVRDYSDMVQAAGEILQGPTQNTAEEHPLHPTFSLATVVVEPLHWITARCREPNIRRKALRLLQLYPRREGICEGMLSAKIGEILIELEETRCPRSGKASPNATELSSCTDGKWICENHRVAVWQFLLMSERRVRVVLKTVEDLRLSRLGTTILTSWW